jgi:tetratricopeptide (TPR) repeat protein
LLKRGGKVVSLAAFTAPRRDQEKKLRALEVDAALHEWDIQGLIYCAKEQYYEGLLCFNHVISNAPKYAWAYVHAGIAYEGLRLYDKAYGVYLKAYELNPDGPAGDAADRQMHRLRINKLH